MTKETQRDRAAAVANVCLRRYLGDVNAGGLPNRDAYRADFAGFEDVVARVFADCSGGARAAEGAAARSGLPAAREALSGYAGDDASPLAIAEAVAWQAIASARLGPGAGSSEWIGPYHIVEELGRGGQGRVYLAEDTRLRRKVALKVLPFGAGADELRRLRREGEIAARLDDSSICKVYEVGESPQGTFVAMQYVAGETLARKLEGDAVPVDLGATTSEREAPRERLSRLLCFVEQTARSLHVMHESGVVHRDLKPSNLVVSESGGPVILDFGLAHLEDPQAVSLTRTGDFLGTPAYMAPEQLRIERPLPADRATDIWSLGIVLYECLTAERPFRAPTRDALVHEIRTAPLPRLRLTIAPRDLEVVVQTALEKDRVRRYHTALELAEELGRIRRHEPVAARPVGPAVRAKRWVERHPTAAVVVGAMLLLATIVPTVLLIQASKAAREIAAREAKAADRLIESLEVVDRMLAQVGDDRLRHVPNAEKLREDLLEEAAQFYEKFLADGELTVRIARERAWVGKKLGELYLELGRPEEGLSRIRDAAAEFEAQTAANTGDRVLRSRLLATRVALGRAQLALGRTMKARRAFGDVFQEAHDGTADDASETAFTIGLAQLGMAGVLEALGDRPAATRRAAEAMTTFARLHAAHPDDVRVARQLFVAESDLGHLYWIQAWWDEAEACLRPALARYDWIASRAYVSPLERQRRVDDLARLSGVLLMTKRPDEGVAMSYKAVQLGEELQSLFPDLIWRQWSTVHAQAGLGFYLMETGDADQGRALITRAIALGGALIERGDTSVPSMGKLLRIRLRFAHTLTESEPCTAEAEYRAVLGLMDRLFAADADTLDYRPDETRVILGLGRTCDAQGRYREAEGHYRLGLRRMLGGLNRRGSNPVLLAQTARIESRLAELAEGDGRAREQLDRLDHARRLAARLCDEFPTEMGARSLLVDVSHGLARAQAAAGECSAAIDTLIAVLPAFAAELRSRAATEQVAEWAEHPALALVGRWCAVPEELSGDEQVRASAMLARVLELLPQNEIARTSAGRELAERIADYAVQFLAEAVAHGVVDVEHLQRDPRFTALRGRPAFQRLLQESG